MTAATMTLSAAQGAALRLYGQDYAATETPTTGSRYAEACDSLRKARAALSLEQRAVVDLIVGRGAAVAEVARQAQRPAADIAQLLTAGADALALHYEARP